MPLSELEQLVLRGQYAQALRVFLELLKDDSLTRQQLAHAYHCGSIARFHMEEYFSALELGRLAEENAVAAGDEVLLGRVWINMIGFYRRVGDTHMALQYGEKWLANMAMFPGLVRQEGKVQYNMALVQRSRRNISQAIIHFKAATVLMERHGLPVSQRVMAHQMCAWVLYENDLLDEGDEQVELAEGLIEEDDHEAMRELVLLKGLRAFKAAEYKEVCATCEEFLTPGVPATTTQLFWAVWLLAYTAAKLGQINSAQAMALLAKDYAMKTKSTDHLNRCSDLQRYILSQLNGEGSAG